jgi:hypothetical protein
MESSGTAAEIPSTGMDIHEVTRENCPYFTDEQFNALPRIHASNGGTFFRNMMSTPAENQKAIVDRFLLQEMKVYQEAFRQGLASGMSNATPASPRVTHLKLETSKFSGGEGENLIRWLTEIKVAISAQNLQSPDLQVAFAMSRLRGRARDWAYGCMIQNSNCFPTYNDFVQSLTEAFQPPKCEFRYRQQLLQLRQGSKSLHDYIQKIRYLSSCITTNPVDEDTLVSIFLQGMRDGPARTQLFRVYPSKLEDAISIALQEEFSKRQAQRNQNFNGNHAKETIRPARDPFAMDISNAQVERKTFDKTKIKCFKCNLLGHMARDCRVNVARSGTLKGGQKRWTGSRSSHNGKPKNGLTQ